MTRRSILTASFLLFVTLSLVRSQTIETDSNASNSTVTSPTNTTTTDGSNNNSTSNITTTTPDPGTNTSTIICNNTCPDGLPSILVNDICQCPIVIIDPPYCDSTIQCGPNGLLNIDTCQCELQVDCLSFGNCTSDNTTESNPPNITSDSDLLFPQAELMFGTLAFATAASGFALKYFEHQQMYTFPLYYEYEFAWYNAGVFFESLWTVLGLFWAIDYFGLVGLISPKYQHSVDQTWSLVLWSAPFAQLLVSVSIFYIYHLKVYFSGIISAFTAVHLVSLALQLTIWSDQKKLLKLRMQNYHYDTSSQDTTDTSDTTSSSTDSTSTTDSSTSTTDSSTSTTDSSTDSTQQQIPAIQSAGEISGSLL